MGDFVVNRMRHGDLKSVKMYAKTLVNMDDVVYKDDVNRLNMLHLAVGLDCEHRDSIVELLINLKANVNYPGVSDNIAGVTPLHIAAMWGYDLTTKLLLLNGSDASARDQEGMSPVDYASIWDNYGCVSILLRYGRLNMKDDTTEWSNVFDSSMIANISVASSTSLSDLEEVEEPQEIMIENCLYHTALNHSIEEPQSRPQSRPLSQSDAASEDGVKAGLNLSQYVSRESLNAKVEDWKPLQIRSELEKLGYKAGPITEGTKRVYLKLLMALQRVTDIDEVISPCDTNLPLSSYSNELNQIITGRFDFLEALALEQEFNILSSNDPSHGPRCYFNYLLIDPRISQNLSAQAIKHFKQTDHESSDDGTSPTSCGQKKQRRVKLTKKFNPNLFARFLQSIFYVGKGQRSRDFAHLYDALADRDSITKTKIRKIRDIWSDGYGVVSLHLFHNVSNRESLTREALMIEAIGLANLTNIMPGSMQLRMAWNDHKRRLLGSLFLFKAYSLLIDEGERQLKREDLKRKA